MAQDENKLSFIAVHDPAGTISHARMERLEQKILMAALATPHPSLAPQGIGQLLREVGTAQVSGLLAVFLVVGLLIGQNMPQTQATLGTGNLMALAWAAPWQSVSR